MNFLKLDLLIEKLAILNDLNCNEELILELIKPIWSNSNVGKF